MIKVERTPVPPKSLEEEKQKKHGSYNKPDVVRQLKADFNDKCYICELSELSDPEVEHLKPHYGRKKKERVFDWNNLFYVCPHCNKIKEEAKYNEKILDCCIRDPEDILKQNYINGHVRVHSITEDEDAIMTADLIESCFEKKNTGIREAACQHRVDKLATSMNILYKTLQSYQNNPDSKRYQRSLKQMLSRKSKFAAFKRGYVRKHMMDYPGLKGFLE